MWDRGAETERGRGEEDGGGLVGGAAVPLAFILQQIKDGLDTCTMSRNLQNVLLETGPEEVTSRTSLVFVSAVQRERVWRLDWNRFSLPPPATSIKVNLS